MKRFLIFLLCFYTTIAHALTVLDDNSSSSILTNSSTFTGDGVQLAGDNWLDITWPWSRPTHSVIVAVKTDQDGVLYMEQSPDGTNWDSSLSYNVKAGINSVHRLTVTRKYYRTRFTNSSGSDQTYFRLQTLVGDSVGLTSPANLSIATDGDALSTRPSSNNDEIVTGRRSGAQHFTKFSYRTSLTAANGEETIWTASGNFTPMTTASTFTITYTGGGGSNDGAGSTGCLTLYIQYVDSSGLQQVGTHTLDGTSPDVTSFSGLGINRVACSSSGSAQTNNAAIVFTDTTGATTQANMPAGGGVTQQAIYHTDSNSYAIIKEIYIQTNRTSGGASPKVTFKMYVFNRTVATRYELFRTTIDTAVNTYLILPKPIGIRLNPADVVYWVADTDQNSTDASIRFSLLEYKIN